MLQATLSLFATVLSAQLEEKPLSAPEAEPVLECGSPALFSWGDADGDARLDLAAVSAKGVLQLLANAGEGRFEDVTERSGLAGIASAALAQWVDYDADGRLDLFVGAREGASRLFHNEGGEFVDMTAASGLVIDGALHSAHWLDHDGDGRIDLHVVAEKKNQIFRGLAGGSFERAELPAMDRPMTGPLGGGAILVPGKLESPEGGGMLAPDRNQTVVITGRLPVIVSPPGLGGGGSVLPAMGGPSSACIPSVTDQANPSTCLFASSSPTLGRLYPISSNLFVAVSGEVGIGTTTPTARLHVAGTARMTDTLTLAPAGDTALDVSTGSIYKGGALFLHTKGGADNTALGREALASVTTGYANTASGYSALRNDTIGWLNTASGYSALRNNTTGDSNTAGGAYALFSNTTGYFNTASGFYALRSNTGGARNTATGTYALFSNTFGFSNTAGGDSALRYNTTGHSNTASGYWALRSNTTGSLNTASGRDALYFNTTGNFNTASGVGALRSNTTGYMNMANGNRALSYNTTGDRNTACGYRALFSDTTGNRNTASGYLALGSNTTGSRNIAIGNLAGFGLTTGSDNIAIGNTGVAAEAATIRIGTAGTHTRAFIAGIRGVTTVNADAIPVLIDSAGQLGTVSSSRRFKEEIEDMGDRTERLLELRPVVFRYKPEVQSGERPLEYGLIAEEVEEVFPELVVHDEDGKPFTVKYHLLSAMLLNELEKLSERHDEGLRALREEYGRELAELRARLVSLEERSAQATSVTPADGHRPIELGESR